MISGFYACDSTTSPRELDTDFPAIIALSISPKNIPFTEEVDGYRDTTISLELQFSAENVSASDQIRYALSDSKGETLLENAIEIQGDENQTYSETIDLGVTTTTIADYTINVFLINEAGDGNYGQTKFKVEGFSNFPPEILETSSPDVINRPASGEVPAVFTAKVVDNDGQETIDRVYIRVINQASGEVQGSPFEMFDDGTNYNDSTASDSVYTWYQSVPPNEENPNLDFDIEFFAIDKGGLSSDTIKTTFSIVE